MSDTSTNFTGSVPEFYDRGLVPNIFEDYANFLTERVVNLRPRRVLELAAGTGAVSERLRAALPDEAELIVSDLNGPMLEIAKVKLKGAPNTSIQSINAMRLPFEAETLEAVTCQFGVMFFPDKVASFREVRRVLVPNGHYVFNVWGSSKANSFSQIVQQLSEDTFPDDPPTFYRVPFHYHDQDTIRTDVLAAGFSQVAVETIEMEKTIKDLHVFVEAIVRGNPICEEIEQRGGDPEMFRAQVHSAYKKAFGEDPSVMNLSAIFVTAVK